MTADGRRGRDGSGPLLVLGGGNAQVGQAVDNNIYGLKACIMAFATVFWHSPVQSDMPLVTQFERTNSKFSH